MVATTVEGYNNVLALIPNFLRTAIATKNIAKHKYKLCKETIEKINKMVDTVLTLVSAR